MAILTRRRFLSISAAGAAVTAAGGAPAAPVRRWEGRALGARAAIRLAHPDGARIAARAFAEIDRLEDIFSLYRAGSALARLNRDGRLDAPPVELVECLGLCGAVHRATEGRFDPTVQPLWTLHAEAHAAGRVPDGAAVAATLDRVVSVTAPRAALADALSTALVLMTREEIARTLAAVPQARLAAAV